MRNFISMSKQKLNGQISPILNRMVLKQKLTFRVTFMLIFCYPSTFFILHSGYIIIRNKGNTYDNIYLRALQRRPVEFQNSISFNGRQLSELFMFAAG